MAGRGIRLSALAVAGFALFAGASQWLAQHPARRVPTGLTVTLPPPVQVLLAGGDRHFAANLSVARVQAYPVDLMRPEFVPVRARIQLDASALNAAHEDNYYLAAATLEEAALAPPVFRVLERAAAARPFDMQPAYYLGVLHVLQLGDFERGARWAALAAQRADSEANRNALERMAARWAMRAQDPELGLRMLESMYAQARTRSLKQYLEERMASVRGLLQLRQAVDTYAAQYGRPPFSFDELRQAGLIDVLPVPAKGFGYLLGANGVPVLARVTP